MASATVDGNTATGGPAKVPVVNTDGNKSLAQGVTILNAAGEIIDPTPTGTNYTEDAVAAANPVGQMQMGVAITALTNEVPDGDNVAARFSRKGERFTKDSDLAALIGEVTASPTDNTVLDRLKDLLTGVILAAGTNHIGQVGSPVKNVQVIPVLDTNIYASGDVLFATTAVALALRTSGGCADLHSLCIVDIDDQKPAMNLVFLRANTALGAFNAAPDIDDTEALDVIGIVPIVAADYLDLGGVSIATLKNIGLTVDATTGTSIYVAAYLTAGTPTHTASGLKFNFGFLQA